MKNIILISLIFFCLSSCASQTAQQPAYVPGLGEFMTQLSYRHAKLWFAGQAQNWEMAAYALAEINEGFADLSEYHPNHNEVKMIPKQIAERMAKPMQLTGTAIKKRDLAAFKVAYEAVTAGCNGCHQANGFGFNVIKTPEANIFTNQKF